MHVHVSAEALQPSSIQLDGVRYSVEEQSKQTWDDAEKFCNDHYDGHLATVRNSNIQSLLQSHMKSEWSQSLVSK